MPSTRTHILLIDPGTTREELNEPIGIGALAGTLDVALGHTVAVDQHYVPLDGPVDPSRLSGCDIIGISTPLGSLAELGRLASQLLALPGSRRPLVVLGGLLATFAPDEVLTAFPEAILVLGEGEDALVGIVRALRAVDRSQLRGHLAQQTVPNLVFRAGDRVVRSPRTVVDLAAAVPPRRDHVAELVRRQGIVRAETSRGCAWGRCTFCAIQHKYADQVAWRTVEADRVVTELAELSAGGARHPFFTDEDFIGSHPERALALAEAIGAARAEGRISCDLTLYVDMRVDTILAARAGGPSGAQVLAAMKRVGLREVFVGIESGVAGQVRRYQKPATRERNLRALELLRRTGLAVDVGFILFDPEMALSEITANLAFLRSAGLWDHDARMTKELRVEAGTLLVTDYRAKGLISGPLDVDGLLYPYRWVDPAVEAVHAAFRTWEAQRMPEVYAIQAATRGEVPSEAERRARRTLLGQIRVVEHEALEALARAAEARTDPARVDLSRWSGGRERLLAQWGQRSAA